MIFVNDLASVRNIPAWMQHMPADVDGMTFVDLVFPAFLFIVGMSIPFSVNNRLSKGTTKLDLVKHILIRTIGLLILGILMVNIGSLNETLTGMNKSLWMILMFIGAILVWNNYPAGNNKNKMFFRTLKISGIIFLIFLSVIYRGGSEESPVWLQTKWWGILGLIGWAYLVSSLIYILFKNHLEAIAGFIALFVFLFIGEKSGSLIPLNYLNKNIIAVGSVVGSHSVITLSGVLLSILFFNKTKSFKNKIFSTLVFSLFLFISGYLLRPLYGISKIYATPSWSLYSSAVCCIIFLFLYWITEIKGMTRWNVFLKPAGTNPLLAYILPSIIYGIISLLGITFFSDFLGEGIIGIVRSVLFSLIILGLTSFLTSIHIQLRL